MKARYIRTEMLAKLRQLVPENLEIYRTGNFNNITVDSAYWFERDVKINENQLDQLRSPEGKNNHEIANCITLYRAMQDLSPYEARDERFWTYVTHVMILDHTRKRWPIPDEAETAVAHIQKHFFARDKRGIERDNAASRLWWIAHLCARVQPLDLDQALSALLFRSDVRANIIERPTTSQSAELFSAIVCRLALSLNGKRNLLDRFVFRDFMQEVNSVGGFKLLECLSLPQIEAMLDDLILNKLGVVEL